MVFVVRQVTWLEKENLIIADFYVKPGLLSDNKNFKNSYLKTLSTTEYFENKFDVARDYFKLYGGSFVSFRFCAFFFDARSCIAIIVDWKHDLAGCIPVHL